MKPLDPVSQQFILHWGEMSSRWGLNRTMAQIHALLYLSETPMDAQEIAQSLSVARSNVSTSLRELQAWGIVRVVHRMGDRRDHFETLKDAWEMFRAIIAQRVRREIDPTIAMLRACVREADDPREQDTYRRNRMAELLDLLEAIRLWYEQVGQLPPNIQKNVLKLGGRLRLLAGSDGSKETP